MRASVDSVVPCFFAISVSESPGLTTYGCSVAVRAGFTGMRVCNPSAANVAWPATPSALMCSSRW